MHKVYLGIGGNLGNKRNNFEEAYHLIENQLGKIVKSSSIYESPPWGFQANEPFWNSVIQIETTLAKEEILARNRSIEGRFGRKTGAKSYESRTMDIDILYYDDIYTETGDLIIPHPRMHQRKFVLVPLAEIAPDLKHPLFRLTSIQMLENCRDESVIKKV